MISRFGKYPLGESEQYTPLARDDKHITSTGIGSVSFKVARGESPIEKIAKGDIDMPETGARLGNYTPFGYIRAMLRDIKQNHKQYRL